jgi:hypothetical protein
MQLRLQNEMKFRGSKRSHLRIDRDYWIHECELMEMPDRKTGVHFRVALEGESGMERLGEVVEERKRLEKCLKMGTACDSALFGACWPPLAEVFDEA